PMLEASTYMVRPAMDPVNTSVSFSFILAGSSQLLVGPASSWEREQIKVQSSTRATSPGSDRTRMLLGRFSGSSGMAMPDRVMRSCRAWYSSAEPSHQWMRSGLHICATWSTQRVNGLCFGLLLDSTSRPRLVLIGVSGYRPDWVDQCR